MTKPVITSIASNYDVTTTNANFNAIADYIEANLLHRDGEVTPAGLAQDLDANDHRILNVGYAQALDDAIPLRQTLELISGDLSSIEDINLP